MIRSIGLWSAPLATPTERSFDQTADLMYDAYLKAGGRASRTSKHEESVTTTYDHSLVVISGIAQFFAIRRGDNIPAEKLGLGRLALLNSERAAQSYDDIRELFTTLDTHSQSSAMDMLLQAALFHDIAKYGEFLSPTKTS